MRKTTVQNKQAKALEKSAERQRRFRENATQSGKTRVNLLLTNTAIAEIKKRKIETNKSLSDVVDELIHDSIKATEKIVYQATDDQLEMLKMAGEVARSYGLWAAKPDLTNLQPFRIACRNIFEYNATDEQMEMSRKLEKYIADKYKAKS